MKYLLLCIYLISTCTKVYGEEIPPQIIEQINEDLEAVSTPLLQSNCPNYSNIQTGSSMPPAEVYRGLTRIYGIFNLRNDIFAVPLERLRYNNTLVFDQGETHGVKLVAGVKLPDNDGRNFEYTYETKLYTDRESPGQAQDFTNEQLHYFSLDNLETWDMFTYRLELGVVGHEKDNDTDPTKASTQQKLLHNEYDEELFDMDYYDVENNLVFDNEYGSFIRLDLGLSGNFVNKSKTLGLNGRLYARPELSTLTKRNNLEAGVSGDIYIGLNNPTVPLIGFVSIPTHAIGLHLGGKLPVSIHQVHSNTKTDFKTGFRPEAEIGFQFFGLEAGYKLQMNIGELPNFVPENKKYQLIENGVGYTDHGDMGEFYLRFNTKF